MTNEREDIYQTITHKIVDAIENGPGEYRCPWHRSGSSIFYPRNVNTEMPYQGVNILALWVAADAKGYQSGLWGTYRQWQARGSQVQKGERGSPVIFYKELAAGERDEGDTEGEAGRQKRFVARASTVFAIEQTDAVVPAPPDEPRAKFAPCLPAERFFAATGAVVRHEGARAFYSVARDEITLPPRTAFHGTPTSTNGESYYATRAHETAHWSGASSRLDRTFGKRFGDDAYAVEELTAELSAAFLCAKLEISHDPRPDHAPYLAHWLRIMKADSRAVFMAASKASQVARYLEGLQPPG